MDPDDINSSVRHFGGFAERAGQRWLAEAQAVARSADQIVAGPAAWQVADEHSQTMPIRVARWSDICVLIPSRTNLRRLERAFRTLRVPYRMESGWLVLHAQEVRDLLSCLRAIDDP